jgi:diguanylate cyclase (GGDEF)-like protein
MEHLGAAVARSRRRASPSFAVMLLDLDRFKRINDTLGHLAGDQLLVAIAHRLARCLREADLAARLGGDEFAILLDGVGDVSDATRSAQRIGDAIATPVDLDGRAVHTTASIGIALLSGRHARGEDLLRDADAAMYRAKELGRARYHVFEDALKRIAAR